VGPRINRILVGASLAAFLLCWTPQVGSADSPRTVYGDSPNTYASPVLNAQEELQAFQTLQNLRNTGQISPADYQRLVMDLAGGHRLVITSHEPLPIAPPPTAIALKPPAPVPKDFRSVSASPQPLVPFQPPLPTPKPKRLNPLTQIQRPAAGPIHLVHTRDVAPF
jgi:hypothetical protein